MNNNSWLICGRNLDKSLVLSGACSVASPALYNTYRTLWGLGEGSELEGKIPLEMNMDLTNYISFSKGCYLGQELTARTKYKASLCDNSCLNSQ